VSRAELTRLSSAVVRRKVVDGLDAKVSARQAGDLWYQEIESRRIDPAQLSRKPRPAWRGAGRIDNLSNQVECNTRRCAGRSGAGSPRRRRRSRRARSRKQQSLSQTESGTRQQLRTGNCGVRQGGRRRARSRAVIARKRHQPMAVGNKEPARRRSRGRQATLAPPAQARYTKIVAPLRCYRRAEVQPGATTKSQDHLIQCRAVHELLCDGHSRKETSSRG